MAKNSYNSVHLITLFILFTLVMPSIGSPQITPKCSQAFVELNPSAKVESIAYQTLWNRISNNSFGTGRRLKNYETAFPGFLNKLMSLMRPARWLDAGAGEGYAAEDSQELSKAMRPHVTIVRYVIKRVIHETENLRIFKGKFFEEISETLLGKFDFITDFYGVFSYAPAVDKILQKYLRLLEKGGSIYLYFEPNATLIRTVDGSEMNLLEWLKSIKGISVVQFNKASHGFMISVDTGHAPKIPTLELERVDDDAPPPRRFYRQID